MICKGEQNSLTARINTNSRKIQEVREFQRIIEPNRKLQQKKILKQRTINQLLSKQRLERIMDRILRNKNGCEDLRESLRYKGLFHMLDKDRLTRICLVMKRSQTGY